MSTSPINFGSIPDPTQSQSSAQQINQDFRQLASSLQAGDLAGSQKAYSALQQLAPNQGTSPIAADFKALGQALQSGNLNAAQGAFSQLKTDISQSGSSISSLLQGHRGHHGGHHHVSSADSDSSSNSNSSSSTVSNPPLNLLA